MPRPLSENPTPAALKKREQRARLREVDPEAYKARRAAEARAYRARVAAARAPPAPPATKANPATADPAGQKQGRALADVQRDVCVEVGDILREAFARSKEDAKALAAALPAVRAQVVEAAGKARTRVANLISVEALAQHLHKHSKAVGDNIDLKTFHDYAVRVLHLQKVHTGEASKTLNLEFLRDVPAVWKTIMTMKAASGKRKGELLEQASRLVYAGAVAGILRRLAGWEKEWAAYSREYTADHQSYDKARDENRLTNAEREKFIAWPKLVGMWHSALRTPAKSRKLTPREMAIFGLYVAIPPRRVLDYSRMRLAWNKKAAIDETKLDKAANWLICSKAGRPLSMVVNRYKTGKRYGAFTRDIPKDLAEVLADYVKAAGIKNGAPLFPTEAGGIYSDGAASRLVGDVFQKVTGQRATVNILRHAIISHFRAGRPSLAAKKALAKAMGHSVGMQDHYDRVDAPDGSEEESDSEAEDSESDSDSDPPARAHARPPTAPTRAPAAKPAAPAKPATAPARAPAPSPTPGTRQSARLRGR